MKLVPRRSDAKRQISRAVHAVLVHHHPREALLGNHELLVTYDPGLVLGVVLVERVLGFQEKKLDFFSFVVLNWRVGKGLLH